MGYEKERWQFVERLRGEGVREADALELLRCATTMQRDAEGLCNGDYPHDNGERPTAEFPCGAWVAPEALKRSRYAPDKLRHCPGCRAEFRALAVCARAGLVAVTQGDPRGAVLRVRFPGRTYSDEWDGLAVPTRP